MWDSRWTGKGGGWRLEPDFVSGTCKSSFEKDQPNLPNATTADGGLKHDCSAILLHGLFYTLKPLGTCGLGEYCRRSLILHDLSTLKQSLTYNI